MNDKTQIGAVNPHAKGVGGHRHRNRAAHKPGLSLGAFFIGQAGVVGNAVNALFAKFLEAPLDIFARGAIHDAGPSGADCVQHAFQLFDFIANAGDTEGEIMACKPVTKIFGGRRTS